MKRLTEYLFVSIILFFTAGDAEALLLQPWTIAETSLFDTTDSLPPNLGSGWFGNSLILNYGGGDGSASGRDGRSETGQVGNFVPSDAIGMSFGVSATTEWARIHVGTQAFSVDYDFIVQHAVITLQDNMDFTSNILSFVPFIDQSYDIPESTDSGITTVEFIFIQDIIDAPVSRFFFQADSRDPSLPSNTLLPITGNHYFQQRELDNL